MENCLKRQPRTEYITTIMHSVICGLVDDAASVAIALTTSGTSKVTLQVRCADADLSRIIGKQGRTARALRTLLIGLAQGAGEYDLDIVQPRMGD